jgi:hypothetical protein
MDPLRAVQLLMEMSGLEGTMPVVSIIAGTLAYLVLLAVAFPIGLVAGSLGSTALLAILEGMGLRVVRAVLWLVRGLAQACVNLLRMLGP